ncbi:ADM-like [Anguilla anguilla]|uniref:ADM-like n=1 Tax=Anguilla anguilla TaxID=7936 RepID=UPI0015A9FC03|nr:ADM-like [Anguilla anguilla]
MRLLLQTFFCWWLLASVAPAVDSAKLDLSSVMKKRLSTWLQSRTKRDLNGVPAASNTDSVQFVRPEDVKDTLKPHSSTDIKIRAKRTKNSVNQSRRTGCSFLPTCTVHDLPHRIHQFNNKLKVDSAPIDKISPLGYGRRRRSLPNSIAAVLGDLQLQAKSRREARDLQRKALREIQRT